MKNLLKISFAVVAFAAVGLGSYKAYGSYTAANMSEEDLLLAENVLALSDDNSGSNSQYPYNTVCGAPTSKRKTCRAEVVLCQGKGYGCEPKACSLHAH